MSASQTIPQRDPPPAYQNPPNYFWAVTHSTHLSELSTNVDGNELCEGNGPGIIPDSASLLNSVRNLRTCDTGSNTILESVPPSERSSYQSATNERRDSPSFESSSDASSDRTECLLRVQFYVSLLLIYQFCGCY